MDEQLIPKSDKTLDATQGPAPRSCAGVAGSTEVWIIAEVIEATVENEAYDSPDMDMGIMRRKQTGRQALSITVRDTATGREIRGLPAPPAAMAGGKVRVTVEFLPSNSELSDSASEGARRSREP